MDKKSKRKQEVRKRGGKQKRILSKKNIIAVSLEIVLWGGGELLGHITPYLKAAAWFIAVLLLVYYLVPLSRYTELFLHHYRKGHLIANRQLINALSLLPIMLLALIAYVFAFNPVVSLMSIQSESEQPRPTLMLDTSNLPVDINYEQHTVTVGIDFLLKNTGDKPAYQTRVRLCAAPLINPKNISAYPDSYDVNPIFAGVTNTLEFRYNFTYSDEPQSGVILIYTNLRYSDAATGGFWYEQPFWFACLLDYQSHTFRVVSALPDWITLFKPFVDDFYTNNQD